ncbi:hypothetical protein [Sphingobacterium multivorum]|uniref:Uncharacterized protein n=1 Tax=Sphingobacterium multivorum TaxID=28454 RepID=A0A2X2IVP0_SPHMU|nr:hypothetical protein [Sphingobacterium multivorum]QRQ64110.1 hypothetical protein I6J33_13780 [Sphingobacterium multivorum]SPZ85374.1 Uncharacterised protein [Sphingobacterium multivorum]
MYQWQYLVLKNFIEKTKSDNIIDSCHLALFYALYAKSLEAGTSVFAINTSEIMQMAKIFSPGTYYMKIKYLQEKNYIEYYPSQSTKVPSMVSMKQEVKSEQRRQIHYLSGSTGI